jgi:hypothetical protein
MPSWVQCPKTYKLIPKEEYARHEDAVSTVYVQGDVEPFVSPIDGTIIQSRNGLRDHNLKHGVTDMRDYGQEWFKKKAKERAEKIAGKDRRSRAERVEAIKEAMYKAGIE